MKLATFVESLNLSSLFLFLKHSALKICGEFGIKSIYHGDALKFQLQNRSVPQVYASIYHECLGKESVI